ncbi:MAG: response regulator, partial [Lachnospiraceae bacterium]|nr:response regulator [Lachnospiraceae bacterium]
LELITEIDPNIPSELFGDETRINQILINLLTNAVKYTEKGCVTMSITCEEKDLENNSVLILFEVRDTGIGIKESDMTKLFESFERLDLEKNRNIEGTGLGMSISQKLLELMDSRLLVSSAYGEGSTFSFRLRQKIENPTPLGDYSADDAGKYTQESERYRESFHAENAHILVVDDTELNLLVITNLLKTTGIKIDTALSGREGIELANKIRYDMIHMDQRMPQMNGTETMKIIRETKDVLNNTTPCDMSDCRRYKRSQRKIYKGRV